MKEPYILRARVIEGSIPMPQTSCDAFAGLKNDNYEIFADYTRENLNQLFDIAKHAWQNGDLSKFEILAWAGGANNHDGDRYLWSIRPDLWNFEHRPLNILVHFDAYEPKPLPDFMKVQYERFWKPLKFGFSLSAYLAHTQHHSLMNQISAAEKKTTAPVARKANHPNIDR